MTHPYAALTPDVVLDACASLGLRPDGRLLGLNSYENRVYQVWLDEGAPVVMKFYRPARWTAAQIGEEHAFACELAEREIPVVAPLALEKNGVTSTLFESDSDPSFAFAVYPRRGGRSPNLEDPKVLEWIGRFLGRIHALGATRAFAERESLTVQSFGRASREHLLAHAPIPADLLEAWKAATAQALEAVEACYARAGAVRSIRLHGDCHAGNVLWTDDGPHFVDLDDSRMGPAVQDLWMLLSGDRGQMTRQFADVLAGYEDFMDFDRREVHLIEALRTLRLIHYSAWIARRWDDPAFPAAFPWFDSPRYWQDRILELREQIALMNEPPIAA